MRWIAGWLLALLWVVPAGADTGQDLYDANCANCHGYEGHGDGHSAKMFDPRPADLTAPHLKHGNSDEDMFKVISKGVPGTAMQGWDHHFKESEIRLIIQFVKTLRKR